MAGPNFTLKVAEALVKDHRLHKAEASKEHSCEEVRVFHEEAFT